MSDQPRQQPAEPRRRDHLRLVTDPPVPVDVPLSAPSRPRTIGRLIAQTALIADSAVARRRAAGPDQSLRGGVGRLLGRFR